MHRVYKDFLRRCLLVLLHYRDLGYGVKQADSYANDYWRKRSVSGKGTPESRAKIQKLLNFLDGGADYSYQTQNIDEMIDQIADQLETCEEAVNDRDLIDTMVRILQLPYARSILSGNTLQMLRAAILLPDELIALKSQLKENMSCIGCGHKLLHGEMAIYSHQGEGSNHGFLCSRCQKPSFVASEVDISRSVPSTSVKGLLTALKRKPSAEEAGPASPDAFVETANSILGTPAAAAAPSFFTLDDGQSLGWARTHISNLTFPANEDEG
jgi:hypothetical protein